MTPYVYDIVPAIILLICIGRGYKTGILRTVLNLICLVIAFSAASLLSTHEMCSGIYDEYLHETMYEHVSEAVDKAAEEAKNKVENELKNSADKYIDESFGGSEQIKQFAEIFITEGRSFADENLPQIYAYFGDDINALLTNPEISGKIDIAAVHYSEVAANEINNRLPLGIKVKSSQIKELLTSQDAKEAVIAEIFGVSSEEAGAAAYVESAVIRPLFIRMISTVIWVTVFWAVNFVLHILIRIILVVRKVEPIKACDSLLGGVLGLVTGAAVIAALCVMIVLLVSLTGGMTYMNEEYFEGTIYFKDIYRFILEFAGVAGV